MTTSRPILLSALLCCTVTGWAQHPQIPIIRNWDVPQHWAAPDIAGAASPLISNSPNVLTFVAVTPCRLVDTRLGDGFTGAFGPPSLVARVARVIPIPSQTRCNIPSAASYSLNFTVVAPNPVGYLTAWPDDKPFPGASTLNAPNGGIVANAAIVPAGADGGIQVISSELTDLVVDINGYFVSSPGGVALPYSASSIAGGALFYIADYYPGNTTDATKSYAAIEGDGGYFSGGTTGNNAGNMGVAGLGGPGNSTFNGAAGTGGIGVEAKGGKAGDASGGGAGAGGGIGVYSIGGTSGFGKFGITGGAGVDSSGGTGGTACVYNAATGFCDAQATGGGPGGPGVIARGGAGGPGGDSGVGLFSFAGTPGVGGTNFNYAGFFVGNVNVTGTLTKGGGAFRIDHPQDPANQYLSHSFVESPDMMNIYNGNTVLDSTGAAWVAMPAWFESLNRDFRYQLTAIGTPAPGLYIAEEISGNRFRIAGGRPGGKVSWTVTGIRQDPFANAYRIPVEEEKRGAEKGMYLNPELYGQPAEKNVVYANHPELLPKHDPAANGEVSKAAGRKAPRPGLE